jgi:hypothetical protein
VPHLAARDEDRERLTIESLGPSLPGEAIPPAVQVVLLAT